jgi:alkanesulfonate monooxygenase SsuD/methylene tetrahydromethanopterin reductase-like flavin-dependent oxidoreductase (luciferase family)
MIKPMIKPWVFEFLYAPDAQGEAISPQDATAVFDKGIALWQRMDELDFEGIFFSEHHFGLSYSPSPNLLMAAIARSTKRLRLGTMGVVLPFYQPWRVLEEIGMLDHLTGGRLEIGCASGVPQEIAKGGLGAAESRERFIETLAILDAWLAEPVISHHGKHYNFDNLRIVPRPLQQPPPKWTTVVSPASAINAAERRSKICTAFESVGRVKEIFDAYRAEADKLGIASGPDRLGIRRNVTVSESEAEALEVMSAAKETTRKVTAGDPRVKAGATALLDAKTGFAIHDDEFIGGTPAQVAEQIIAQCRATGAGHIVAILGRAVDAQRVKAVELFGQQVIPILRKAEIG